MHALLVILLGLLLRAACLNGVVSVHGDVNELGCCLAPQRALLWPSLGLAGKTSTPVQTAFALDVGAAAGGLEHLVQKALGRLEHCRRGLRVGELLGTSEAGAPEEVALHEVGIGCGEAGTRGD